MRETSYAVQRVLELLGDPAEGDDDRGAVALQAAVSDMLARPSLARCLDADLHALQAQGFAAVVLHRDRLPDAHGAVERLLATGWGPPIIDSPTIAVWHPTPGDHDRDPACALDPVELRIGD